MPTIPFSFFIFLIPVAGYYFRRIDYLRKNGTDEERRSFLVSVQEDFQALPVLVCNIIWESFHGVLETVYQIGIVMAAAITALQLPKEETQNPGSC